jgi:uncharacterized membrane protein YbhN (UPF0104 family)
MAQVLLSDCHVSTEHYRVLTCTKMKKRGIYWSPKTGQFVCIISILVPALVLADGQTDFYVTTAVQKKRHSLA